MAQHDAALQEGGAPGPTRVAFGRSTRLRNWPPSLPAACLAGAIQAIEKLLKNAEKRAAAITTLGKTVERCRAKLAAANPACLTSLFNVLDGVSESAFQYDIEWINNNMQRTRQQQVR
eukprot:GHRQ01038045.1.p2 GENE.GHRQ01038045.1~~GHRQ01038045.1.p2  ORF type:complete len:118 (+),score=47.28 GHRQ01038045.1:316-669(+)